MEHKILIIDDDRFYSQYLNLILSKFYPYHHLISTTNCADAWQVLKNNPWDKVHDLIILDLELPRLNGFGFLRMIKKHRKVAENCPRILINSNFKFPDRINNFKEIDYRFFNKPVHIFQVHDYLTLGR